jgi:hypothetical protein
MRVLSPTHDQESFKTYFDNYIDKVWPVVEISSIFTLVKGSSRFLRVRSGRRRQQLA